VLVAPSLFILLNLTPQISLIILVPHIEKSGGCSIECASGTFGPEFNKYGGVFAAEWVRESFFKGWVFLREQVPSDIGQVFEFYNCTIICNRESQIRQLGKSLLRTSQSDQIVRQTILIG
jgi:hypothetical protein